MMSTLNEKQLIQYVRQEIEKKDKLREQNKNLMAYREK